MRTFPEEVEFAKYLLSVGDDTLNVSNNNLIASEQCVANKNDDIVEKWSSINKSQGQTFDKIEIDPRKNVFNHGQLYFEFYRIRSWKSLRIFIGNEREKNYVHSDRDQIPHDYVPI